MLGKPAGSPRETTKPIANPPKVRDLAHIISCGVLAADPNQYCTYCGHLFQTLPVLQHASRAFRTRHRPKIAMAESRTAAAASSQVRLVNDSAMNVLKFSKGVMRVPLEDLGPALFNRRGAATCGQHCLKLAERILNLEGFATFRYVAGFCHEANPDDPLAVARHGNAMQASDAALPRLPMKPLKGVFAKTHLVTFLQMYKAGLLPNIKLKAPSQSDSGKSEDVPRSHEELHDVLEHGIFMQVFPWSVVRDHKDAVIALMASDNFDHGHGLTDSEIRCIQAVREAIAASSQGLCCQCHRVSRNGTLCCGALCRCPDNDGESRTSASSGNSRRVLWKGTGKSFRTSGPSPVARGSSGWRRHGSGP